eukprot:1456337-Pyramimonas_sp.AAC.1
MYIHTYARALNLHCSKTYCITRALHACSGAHAVSRLPCRVMRTVLGVTRCKGRAVHAYACRA